MKGLQLGLKGALKLIGKDPKKSVIVVKTVIKVLQGLEHLVNSAEKIVQKVEGAVGAQRECHPESYRGMQRLVLIR